MCAYITTVLWGANFGGWLSYWNSLLAIKTDSMEKSTLENVTVFWSRNSSHFIKPICLLSCPQNTFHRLVSQIITFLFCGCYGAQRNRVSGSWTQMFHITVTQINCCTMFVTPQTQPVSYIHSLDTIVQSPPVNRAIWQRRFSIFYVSGEGEWCCQVAWPWIAFGLKWSRGLVHSVLSP